MRWTPAPIPEGLTATGGVINYTDPGGIYRAHIFTASGSLVVQIWNHKVEYSSRRCWWRWWIRSMVAVVVVPSFN